MYQIKLKNGTGGNRLISILHDGKILEPLDGLFATKEEALCIGKLLEAANDSVELRNVLRVVEWQMDQDSGLRFCPICKNWQTNGHTKECRLGTVLK